MTKFKIQNKLKIKIPKQKFCHLCFGICHYFVICALVFAITNYAYALNLDKIKVAFLSGDYKQAIIEGEKILAGSGERSVGLDELYYLLAVSYLKDGNLLRASDIFEIILSESKANRFKEEAIFGLADTYLLREDFSKAEKYYLDLLSKYPDTKLKAQVYYRLSQVSFKQGNTRQAEEYIKLIKEDFPASLELRMDKSLPVFNDSGIGIYYTVQTGAFSKITNARNLCDKLIKQGFDAYIEETNMADNGSYRVRVGKLKLRAQAVELEKKLSSQGYSTKIYP
ncbi:MAG: SPOR domain-containing protein [Candidatus Omnitrophica bacterium]|jgi:tetratricopeptide (TPR) repeat protein|nr:SPOR domain-containing protein [Candidatus Omnitrophota bacterium]